MCYCVYSWLCTCFCVFIHVYLYFCACIYLYLWFCISVCVSGGSLEVQSEQLGPCENIRDTVELTESGNEVTVTVVGNVLSHKALVLRRGLTLAGMLFILAMGLIINLLISNFIQGAK